MNKYICEYCKIEFDVELYDTPKLVKILLTRCPKCGSIDYNLTPYGKLMIERRAKLIKLESIENR